MQIKTNSGTRTITEFIDASKDNSLQFQNSSFYTFIKGVPIEKYNIYRDVYLPKLLSMYEIHKFTDDEFDEYKYRPKGLSAKLFGTIDYFYIILLMNEMSSHLQFKKKVIKVPTFQCIEEIKKIAAKEEKAIVENNTKI